MCGVRFFGGLELIFWGQHFRSIKMFGLSKFWGVRIFKGVKQLGGSKYFWFTFARIVYLWILQTINMAKASHGKSLKRKRYYQLCCHKIVLSMSSFCCLLSCLFMQNCPQRLDKLFIFRKLSICVTTIFDNRRNKWTTFWKWATVWQ